MTYPVCPQCGFASMFAVCSRCGTDRRNPPTPPNLQDLKPYGGQHVAVDHDGNVIGADDILGDLLSALAHRPLSEPRVATILHVPNPDDLDKILIEITAPEEIDQ